MSAIDEMKDLFLARLLPERQGKFECLDQPLEADWSVISETDARYFLAGFHSGLIAHDGKGGYRAERSSADTLFLNSPEKKNPSGVFKIRKEEIPAIGSLYRLHTEFGWPSDLLGLEWRDLKLTKKYPFDLHAFNRSKNRVLIAAESKKENKDLYAIVDYIKEFGSTSFAPNKNGRYKNAPDKLEGLRLYRPEVFWLIGLNQFSIVFKVHYDGQNVSLSQAPVDSLDMKNFVN